MERLSWKIKSKGMAFLLNMRNMSCLLIKYEKYELLTNCTRSLTIQS